MLIQFIILKCINGVYIHVVYDKDLPKVSLEVETVLVCVAVVLILYPSVIDKELDLVVILLLLLLVPLVLPKKNH